jgi:TrmH family RNA methyltransferase
MTCIITSHHNQNIKEIKKLKNNPSYRQEKKTFILEGKIFILDLIQKAPEYIQAVFCSENISQKTKFLTCSFPIFVLKNSIFKSISDLSEASGLLAIIKMPQYDFEKCLAKTKSIVILDQLQNPQNVGSVLRNVAAFNIDMLLYTKGTADPFHPQSLRAMAGNFYQTPIIEVNKQILEFLQKQQFNFYLLDPKAKQNLNKTEFMPKAVFIFGSEGQGLKSKDLITTLSSNCHLLKIPLNPQVDSLNVAVSSGIVFYTYQNNRR